MTSNTSCENSDVTRPPINKSFNKVFEIGSPKTGTTSLDGAYRILGLRAKGYDKYLQGIRDTNLEEVLECAKQYDAFQDGPWHNIDFRILDQTFPNSRFILLERDDESWYKSMEYQFKIKNQHDWFTNFSKSWHINDRNKKYRIIKEYFANRPGDLLVLNLFTEEDPWGKLCDFLKLPRPPEGTKFPHWNKNPNNDSPSNELKSDTREVDKIRLELKASRKKLKEVREELDKIYTSSSWRLTKPLRRIASLFMRSR